MGKKDRDKPADDIMWDSGFEADRPPATMATPSEAAVLAQALVNPDSAARAADTLDIGDFIRPTAATMFSIIKRRVRDGEPVDAISVGPELDRATGLPGCTERLADLLGAVATTNAENLDAHIRTLKKATRARELHKATSQALERFEAGQLNGDETIEILDKAVNVFRAGTCEGEWVTYATAETIAEAEEFSDHWIVPDLLGRGWMVMFGGEPKAGKTTTARELIFSLVQGGRFLNWPVAPAPPSKDRWRVMYLDIDMPEKLAFTEIGTCLDSFGVPREHIGTDEFPLFYASADGQDVTNRESQERLIRELRSNRIDLLVVDVFAKLFVGAELDESRANDMNRVHEGINAVRQATGVTVVLLSHLRKRPADAPRRLTGTNLTAAVRGSSAITGNVDFIWGQVRDGNNCTFIVGPGRSRQVRQNVEYPLEMEPLDDDGTLFRIYSEDERPNEDLERIQRYMTQLQDGGAGALRQELLDLFLSDDLKGQNRRSVEGESPAIRREVRAQDSRLADNLKTLETRRVLARAKDGQATRYWLVEHAPDHAECAGVRVDKIRERQDHEATADPINV